MSSGLADVPLPYNMHGSNYSEDIYEGSWTFLGKFETTAYTAGFESCGKLPSDPSYGITRSGLKVTENQTIAADWGVIPEGSFVIIEGLDPIYVVEDTGGAIKGNKLDIYMEDLGEAQQWGRQNRKVWVMEELRK